MFIKSLNTRPRFFLLLALAVINSAGAVYAEQGTHKVIVYKHDKTGLKAVEQLPALEVFDYQDRKVFLVTDQVIKQLPEQQKEKLPVRDDLNKIYLRAATLDTSKPIPTVPQALRHTPTMQGQQYLIQFAGPVKDEWLNEIKQQGNVKIITYIPNNAYLIWLDGATLEKVQGLATSRSFLQWTGAYHPAYKIHPALQSVTSDIKITVQLVKHEGVASSVDFIKSKAKEIVRDSWSVGSYNNLRVIVSPSDINSIANLPDVVNIEPFARDRYWLINSTLPVVNRMVPVT